VESIDVKYVLGGGFEKEIDPAVVSPFETLERGGRKRRGRDFLMERADVMVKKVKQVIRKNGPMSGKEGATKPRSKTVARRTKEPDHSTSPSTPITPEHPSVSKSSAAKKGSFNVPSFVIADRAMEVSPLPVDRAVAEPTESTVARRGLFGCSGTSTAAKKKNSKPQAGTKVATKQRIQSNSSDSFTEDGIFHTTAQAVSKAHSTAMKDSLMMKQGKGLSSKLGGSKEATLVDRKVAAVASGSTRKTTKATLKGVFDYELRKAREFLEEVCRAPSKNDTKAQDPAWKENRLNTSVSEDEADCKPPA